MSDFNIWEGVFGSFAEAGGSTLVFSEALWVQRSKEKAIRLRDTPRTPTYTPPANATHEYCAPVIAALVQAQKGFVRILEFGGSVGLSFGILVEPLADPSQVEVHVVDNENICRAGRDVFAGEPRISFHTDVPRGVAFDLVHCGSSIQYSADWAGQIETLVASGPDYLVFDDLPAGDIPSFVSLQNYYGKKIPHWFFDIREFIETVTRVTGYRLCYKSRYIGTFLGRPGPFPMNNFPERCRIDHAYNIAFVRSPSVPFRAVASGNRDP